MAPSSLKLSEKIAMQLFYDSKPKVTKGTWSYLSKVEKDSWRRKSRTILGIIYAHSIPLPDKSNILKELDN